MSDDAHARVEVEGSGETVGEAKWTALRELERRFPGLDTTSVRFTVLAAGERGLLGVGFTPARVLATIDEPPPTPPAARPDAPSADTPAGLLHELVSRAAEALGCAASVAVSEDEDALTATLAGPDLGRLIGRHGQTIDALQSLAGAILTRRFEGERKDVIVDAAGYRDRRRAALERAGDRAAEDALRRGEPVALDPMSAIERKIVHVHLAERVEVETASEGAEPNRYVVVRPAPGPGA